LRKFGEVTKWLNYEITKVKKLLMRYQRKPKKNYSVIFSLNKRDMHRRERETKVHIHKNKQNYITQIIVTHSILF